MSEWGLLTTESLIRELASRCDVGIVALAKLEDGTKSYVTKTRRWGSPLVRAGLMIGLEQELEEDFEGFEPMDHDDF